jgi:hypothetical protein
MGETRNAYKILVRKPEGKRPLGRHKRRWGIIGTWILKKWLVRVWIGCIWLRIETTAGIL